MIYVLEVFSDNIQFKVKVNDIVVLRSENLAAKTTQLRLSHFIMNGKNKVEVNALSDESKFLNGDLKLKILSGEKGTMPGEETVLIEMSKESLLKNGVVKNSWMHQMEEFHSNEESLDLKLHLCGEMKDVDFSFQECKNLLRELESAIASKDIERVLELLEHRSHDMALASKVEKSEFEGSFKMFLESLIEDKNFSLKEINYDKLKFEFEYFGKVMRLFEDSLSPVIFCTGNGKALDIDAKFGFIHGRLSFVF